MRLHSTNLGTAPPDISERLHLVTSRPAHAEAPRSPLVLWHLLSLDAPTVAATWTLFVAWTAGVRIAPADPIAMFLAVWMLYAADRLLDARPLSSSDPPLDPAAAELEDRHRFHHRHRSVFLRCLVAGTLPLAFLLHRLAAPVLHLYALLASLLVGWLLLVHARPTPSPSTRRLPKELAVGLFFPAAVFIPTVARAPRLQPALLPSALLFAAVCSLNCLFLYAWEHPNDRSRAHGSTRWALRHIMLLSWALILGSAALGCAHAFGSLRSTLAHPVVLPLCCAFSSALLLLLHRLRFRIAPLPLRAFADFVLLSPLALLLLDKGPLT